MNDDNNKNLSMVNLITSNELTDSLERIGKQMLSAFTPLNSYLTQSEMMLASFREMQEQLNNAFSFFPLQDFNKRMEDIFAPLRNITFLNMDIQNVLKIQSDALKSLSDINFTHTLSVESSKEFAEISESIIQEIGDSDLFENLEKVSLTPTSKSNKLTFQDVLNIITLIVTIIALLQSSLPDKQSSNIERLLQQLVDIQTYELELIQQPLE